MNSLYWFVLFASAKAIDSITTYEGASFIKYVTLEEDETLLRCELILPDDAPNVTINVNSGSAIQEAIYKGRLYSIGRGICGVKVVKASPDDPKKLAFHVTKRVALKEPITSTHEFEVEIKKYKEYPNEEIVIKLSDSFKIMRTMNGNILWCRIYNPSGIFVTENNQCKYESKQSTMEDVGQWTLEYGMRNNMEPMRAQINITLKVEKELRAWYEEKDGYGLINCNYPIQYTKCVFTRPDKKVFLVTDTFASERYTAIGSNLDEGFAQIQFKLPLMNSEIGRWTCKFAENVAWFISVGPPSRSKQEPFKSYANNVKKIIAVGKPFEIRCSVPHPIDNCVIKDPNGTIHYMNAQISITLGECLYKVESGKVEDKGVWTCYLSNPVNIEDDIITTEVEISNELKPSDTELNVYLGDSATLLFKRPNPIDMCYCVSPAGTTYFLSESKTQGNIVYEGKGLRFGECGMTIRKAEAEFDGVWECFSKIHSYEDTLYGSQMRLSIDERLLKVVSIGVPVGISIAAVVIISLIGYYCYKKRRNYEEQDNRSSLSSEHSDTLFIINSPFQRN